VNKIIVIIFLSVMFNFSSPEINIFDPSPKHTIEYSQEINKKEKDKDIIKKKVMLYCKLLELQTQVSIVNRQFLFNSS
jgi:hypothetical protein